MAVRWCRPEATPSNCRVAAGTPRRSRSSATRTTCSWSCCRRPRSPREIRRPTRRGGPPGRLPTRRMHQRLTCACLVLATTAVGRAAADRPALTDVLARVGDYVVRYERELSGIVAEEQYAQTADVADRPNLTHRELKSDLLLVQAQGRDGQGFIQFRDVFEVDGESVRDRGERLVTLFVNPSTASRDQAFAIMRESSRYNIGSVERNVNVPVLALSFMHPRYQPRFKFTLDSEGAGVPRGMPKASNFSLSVDVRVLHFREVGSPPLIDSRNSRVPAKSSGR